MSSPPRIDSYASAVVWDNSGISGAPFFYRRPLAAYARDTSCAFGKMQVSAGEVCAPGLQVVWCGKYRRTVLTTEVAEHD